MEENKNKESSAGNVRPGDKSELLQEFIEQKKLQNRILGEILEKIKKADESSKSQPTLKNEKP
jgi:hypothetical protein